MKRSDYEQMQGLLLTYAQSLEACFGNLDDFIEAIERAEATGPSMDPTLWMQGHENMQQIKVIAVAIQSAKKDVVPALQKLKENLNREEI